RDRTVTGVQTCALPILSRTLGKPALRNEITTARPDDVAVVQSLELLNGQEWNNLIYGSPVLLDLAKEIEQPKVIDKLYRSALSRSEERRVGKVWRGGW